MAISDAAKEIRKLTATANDTARTPDVRLLAARKLLRDTGHSARSVRVAKRVAKLFMNDQNATAEQRKKAASLFEFVCDQRETEEDASAPESIEQPFFLDAFSKKLDPKPHAEQLAEKNANWNVPQYNKWLGLDLPNQWIFYKYPEDLIAYGVPPDPRFALRGHVMDTFKLFIDGVLFYVEFGIGRWDWSKVSNPQYLEALGGRHVNWSCCSIDTIDPNGQIVKNLDGNQY
jgi:hypothetical protein